MHSEQGVHIILYPYLAEKLDNADSVPCMREELREFTSNIEQRNPGLIFDWKYMNKLTHENLWFLSILDNHRTANTLEDWITIGDEFDPGDKKIIHYALYETNKKRRFKIEGNEDFFYRTITLKEKLEDEILFGEGQQELVQADPKNKILVITHEYVMKALMVHPNKAYFKTYGDPEFQFNRGYQFSNCEVYPY